MYKKGLKLWSINTDKYFDEAVRLYNKGIYDYIELYVVPDSLDNLLKWKTLEIPFIIHCPHFAHGFNLAKREKQESNRKIFSEVQKYADELNAPYIVVHGGIDGDIRETAVQMTLLNEPRALIENKPYVAIPNRMGGEFCRGYNVDEIKTVIESANCGFCLDFGHAICAANSIKQPVYSYIEQFLKLNPDMYHLTDIEDITSPYDSHPHLGTGQLDIKRVLGYIPEGKHITFETIKNSKENLDDFIEDMNYLKSLENKITLKNVEDEEIKNTFSWICDKTFRKLFLMRGEPDWDNHVNYFKKIKADITQRIYAIFYDKKHIGNCGFKYIKGNCAELWIYIGDNNFRGKRLSKPSCEALIQKGKDELNLKKIYLHVLKTNTPAVKLYNSLNFKLAENNEEDFEVWGDKINDIFKYELDLSAK